MDEHGDRHGGDPDRSDADRIGTRSWSLAGWAAGHSSLVIAGAVAITLALSFPFLAMGSDELASQEPAGPVFEARDELEDRFGAGVVGWFFVVEARDGEMLDRDSLVELRERLTALEEDQTYGPLLITRTDTATGETFDGVVSLVGPLDSALRTGGTGGIVGADDDTVRASLSRIIDERGPGEVGVSAQAVRDDVDGRWSAPALTLSVLVDGTRIPDRGTDAGFGSDVAVEEAARDVQTLLRDSDSLDVWGIAIDQSLTGAEQGEAAGPFIGFTVLVIVLLVGAAFRSYWVLAVVGAALVALLVWLQGIANLVGLKDDQILSTVVPIAMIAFGVDYAFHSVGRYREERAHPSSPKSALTRGLGGVIPALLLALATGVFAFLANVVSGIESITQFGIAAAISLVSAFVVLGIVVPVSVAVIDERTAGREVRGARTLGVIAGIGAASTAMTTVLFTVFLSPPVGLVLLAGYLVAFVLVPVAFVGRRPRRSVPDGRTQGTEGPGRVGTVVGDVVSRVAARRRVVLPVIGAVSVLAGLYAVQVPASFDVEDFFAQDTDFVIGLDKLDEHVGTQGGERAEVLVSGDLTDPRAIEVLRAFTMSVAQLDTPLLARGADGRVEIQDDALSVLEGTSTLTAPEIAQVVAPAEGDDLTSARLSVGLVGSRAQENVEATRTLLDPLVAQLESDLGELQPDSRATLTGTPIVRQASMDAVSRSLQVSVAVAVLLCLLVAWVVMRSFRYALTSLVPIVLVVAWLYGFMYVAGFSINLVTATIGAISIGVGIDFATHMTMRYREELARSTSRREALRAAAAGTGVALVGSTVSSAAGFAILAFAPMPMFASYGLLTAVMITLALAATLVVLPGLLMLVSREPDAAEPTATDRTGPEIDADSARSLGPARTSVVR
jgi:uncharacterized protein